jgi:hypothetical protein
MLWSGVLEVTRFANGRENGRLAMDRIYDIFELFPNKSVLWRTSVHGTQNVAGVLAEIGKRTPNECFAMNIDTREIIARVNVKPEGANADHSPERVDRPNDPSGSPER